MPSCDSSPIGGSSSTATQRTPRLPQEPLSRTGSRPSSPTKPTPRRGSTLGPHPGAPSYNNGGLGAVSGSSDRRRGSVPRTLSTPSHADLSSLGLGLGLGNGNGSSGVDSRRAFKDDTLSSPRRISTSAGFGLGYNSNQYPSSGSVTGNGLHTATSTSSSSGPTVPSNMPTNEAYYSQPPSASTPRFRQPSLHPSVDGYGSLSNSHIQDNSRSSNLPSQPDWRTPRHRRNFSVHSTATAPPHAAGQGPVPATPVGSVIRKIRKTASAIGLSLGTPRSYDGHDDSEDEGEGAIEEEQDESSRINGTRVWYSSYVTIDWIHDAIKESSRVRRVRTNARKSYRGRLANTWDRLQGWVVVTIVGILSAIIAFLVIRTEMALFDLKEGFCATSWSSPKRFCCTPRHRFMPVPERTVASSYLAFSPVLNVGQRLVQPQEVEECPDWIDWGDWWERSESGGWVGLDVGGAELGMYAIIALALAGLSSVLTIYLTSSEYHITSKDSALALKPAKSAVPGSSGDGKTGQEDERQPLLAAGRSSPEIKRPVPRKVMYYAAGSGIPEIKCILSGFVIHGYLGGWTLFTKSFGLALSVASGLSLGKEGPFVHIASCVGNIVSRLFLKFELNEAKRRETLSAACAAGVSVAFGAPVGGVLFSLEEVSYYFPPKVMWRSFWCAAVAAITLKALNPFGNGSIVLLEVTYTKPYHAWEFAIFIFLGVFGGIYGALFSRLNILWSRHIRQGTMIGRHPIVEVLLVTAMTTLLSFMNPYCRMGGTELVAKLFAECKHDSTSSLCVERPNEILGVITLVGAALVIKGGLTIITFGIKLPAGIFIPSLVVGACAGRIAGLCMEWIEHTYPHIPIFDVCRGTDCIVPGLYAMIGAAATLAGVTRTTVSLVVIMLELTGSLNYVVPVMLAVLLAKTVADMLEKKGIYDLVIDLNQLPYLDSKHEYLWGSRTVEEIADWSIPILRADKSHTVRSLTGRLLELARGGMSDTGFPVIVRDPATGRGREDRNDDGRDGGIGLTGNGKERERGRDRGGLRVVGFIGMNELEHALGLLADEPDARLNLMPSDDTRMKQSMHSVFSFTDSLEPGRARPYDLSRYIDRAPITVQPHSPLELVQQLFVKLGARQLLVVDNRGVFRGIVMKKSWLNFLAELALGRH